jgi:hypothetical protein
VYESLLHLLRACLPEFLGSLVATAVLAAAGRSARRTRERLRTRRAGEEAPPTAPADDGGHRRSA